MFKQSPSRNNRSKGFKTKYILQICLLLVVCFWLIYQVKRSHNKKEEFDTEDEKVVEKVQSDAEILRLGRKDLPRITETATDEHSFDEEEQEAEEEENKHEDDDQDIEDNISDDREDEMDANDLEKAEAETVTEHEDEINKSEKEVEKTEPAHERLDNEGDSVDIQTENEEIDGVEDEDRSESEEREEAKDDHGEAEEYEGGNKADHDEGDVKLEEHVHDGDRTNTHEAREEQYKADDASSEVAHDNQTIMPETGNATIEHTNETVTSNMEDVGLHPRQDEANSSGTLTNITVTEFKEPETNSVLSQNGTIEGGSGNENMTMAENILKHINKSEGMVDENQLQLVAGSNNTENVTTSTMLVEGVESEDNGTVDSDESANVIPHDLIDESDSTLTQDEKDSRMDLDTLPEITIEVQNTDDTMAE